MFQTKFVTNLTPSLGGFGGSPRNKRACSSWRAWDKLRFPKRVGGLGFKKAKDINNALLAKLAWMIASKRDSLCVLILRAKYKVKHGWLRIDPPKSASPIWKAIEKAKRIVIKGACYAIGDGSSVDVWQDPWVPWIHGFIPSPRDEAIPQLPIKVSQLILHELHCWKADLIYQMFEKPSAQAILAIPVPLTSKEDELVWVLDLKGVFLVKSAYLASNPQFNKPVSPTVN